MPAPSSAYGAYGGAVGLTRGGAVCAGAVGGAVGTTRGAVGAAVVIGEAELGAGALGVGEGLSVAPAPGADVAAPGAVVVDPHAARSSAQASRAARTQD